MPCYIFHLKSSFFNFFAGGIGEAVSSAVSGERNIIVKRLAVQTIPRSGKPEELLCKFGIDANSIAAAVKEILKM